MTGIYRKTCAVFTVFCFLLTMSGNVYGSVSDNVSREDRYVDIDLAIKDKAVIAEQLGKVTGFRDLASGSVVVNIQDLHCDYSVQKNISGIIKELADKYAVEKIYVEGGIGEIKTDWINLVKEQSRGKVLENLVKMGRLSGAELYAIGSGNKVPLYGLEQEKLYSENMARYRVIKAGGKEDERYIGKIDREIEYLRAKYLSGANRKFSEIVDGYGRGEISQDKYFAGLIKYLKEAGISVLRYPNICRYLGIYDGKKEVDVKKVAAEMRELTGIMRETVSFNRYKEIMAKTDNLTDVTMLKAITEKFCLVNDIDFKVRYPNLRYYFELRSNIGDINQAELIREERVLVADIRAYLSDDKTDLEISYISDFSEVYKKYLRAELTAGQWEYFKVGFDKFRQLYAKYSISNDVDRIRAKYKMLNEFYEVNCKRDEIFAGNMDLEKGSGRGEVGGRSVKEVLEQSKSVIILVTGGFHSSGMDKILADNNVTTITVTPNLGKVSAEQAREKYESIMNQKKIQTQTIALKLLSNEGISEQTKQIILSMVMDKGTKAEISDVAEIAEDILSKETAVSTDGSGLITIKFEDGRIINIEASEAAVKEIERQTLREVPKVGEEIVRVAGEELKDVLRYFEAGKCVFAPEVYEISKGLCIFAVNNKWYLGDGAIWEIEQARRNGDSELNLDGVEPVVYEYMPGFMQKILLEKQQKILKNTHAFKIGDVIKRTILSIVIGVMLLVNVSCSLHQQDTPPGNSSQYEQVVISETDDLQNFFMEDDKNLNVIWDAFVKGGYPDGQEEGPYLVNTFDVDETDVQTPDSVKSLQNLYSQALLVIDLLQAGEIKKAEEIMIPVAYSPMFKSNMEGEQHIVTGEIVWMGIAAMQYKNLTGSSNFDCIIERVDKYLAEEVNDSKGFYYGEPYTSYDTAYISTEHQLDVLGYFLLKSLNEKYDTPELQEKILLLSQYIYDNCYDEQNSMFYRGTKEKDAFEVLDVNAWGIQVLSLFKSIRPDIYEQTAFFESDINLENIMKYIENNFSAGNGLYRFDKDPSMPVSLGWSSFVAADYYILAAECKNNGNDAQADIYAKKAEEIIRQIEQKSVSINGSKVIIPTTDGYYAQHLSSYGYEVYDIAEVEPTVYLQIVKRMQELWSNGQTVNVYPYYPIPKFDQSNYDPSQLNTELYDRNVNYVGFKKYTGANWMSYVCDIPVDVEDLKTITFKIRLNQESALNPETKKMRMQFLPSDRLGIYNDGGHMGYLEDVDFILDSEKKEITVTKEMIKNSVYYSETNERNFDWSTVKIIFMTGEKVFTDTINKEPVQIEIESFTIEREDGTIEEYVTGYQPEIPTYDEVIKKPNAILPQTIPFINGLISSGKATAANIVMTILKKETWQSVMSPAGFVKSHPTALGKQGAGTVAKAVRVSSAVAFFTMAGSLATVIVPAFAIPLVGVIALTAISLIAAFVVRFPASMITQTVIDLRHIKSLGLEEAVKKYGKDNIMLTQDGVAIKDNPLRVFKAKYLVDKKTVYIVSDKPENSKEFNFKPVPINFILDSKKVAKTWLGNRKGATVIYVEWLRYDDLIKQQYGEIINMLQESRYFQEKYGVNAKPIEIDFNNPDRQLEYSESGSIIIGVNGVSDANGNIDGRMVVSLLHNAVVDGVTVNRNSAIQIDVLDGLSAYSDLEKFISDAKTADTKIIFSEKEFEKVLELIRIELSKNTASKKLENLTVERFLKLTKDANNPKNNLSVIIRYSNDADIGIGKEDIYGRYGITSFIFDSQFGSKYYDRISGFASDIKEISDLNDLSCDGVLYVFKLSSVVKNIKETSSIFTFLKSVNVSKILKEKNIDFVKQAVGNFAFDQFPQLSADDKNNIIDVLRITDENIDYTDVLKAFFKNNSSVIVYFNSLKNPQLRYAFARSVMERMLLVGYLANNGIANGFANKSHEDLLTRMLVKKYLNGIGEESGSDSQLNIVTEEEMRAGVKAEDLTIIERQQRLNKVLMGLMPLTDDAYALKFAKQHLSVSNDRQAEAVNGIIKLLTLYADREVYEPITLETAGIINMANFKAVLSAA